jgi:hypothetical protein
MATGAETVRGRSGGFTTAESTGSTLHAAFGFAREVAEAKGPSNFVQDCTSNTTSLDRPMVVALTWQAGMCNFAHDPFRTPVEAIAERFSDWSR